MLQAREVLCTDNNSRGRSAGMHNAKEKVPWKKQKRNKQKEPRWVLLEKELDSLLHFSHALTPDSGATLPIALPICEIYSATGENPLLERPASLA